MVKAKKSAAKKPARAGKKHIKVVDVSESALDVSEAADPVPTPAEYVQAALQHIKASVAQFELCIAMLNDGQAYFATVPVERRKALIEAINDFAKKGHFGLSSLEDEIAVALQEQTRVRPEPELDLATPAVPRAIVAPEATPSADQLKELVQLFGVTLTMLANTEIQAFQYEQAGKVLNFVRSMHDRAKSDLTAALEAGAT